MCGLMGRPTHVNYSPGELRSSAADACMHRHLRSTTCRLPGATCRTLARSAGSCRRARLLRAWRRMQGEALVAALGKRPIHSTFGAVTAAAESVDAACDRHKEAAGAGPGAKRMATWRCLPRRRRAVAALQGSGCAEVG